MNQGNYSHILNIKVFCSDSNSTSGFSQSIAYEKIANKFLNEENEYYGVKLKWRKIDWNNMDKFFELGDFVIDSPFGSDEIILEAVKQHLTKIQNELYEEKTLLPRQRIIFKIVKPLVNRIPLVDSVVVLEPL